MRVARVVAAVSTGGCRRGADPRRPAGRCDVRCYPDAPSDARARSVARW